MGREGGVRGAARAAVGVASAMVAAVVTVAAVEGGCRTVLHARGRPWDGVDARERALQIESEVTATVPRVPGTAPEKPAGDFRGLSPYYAWEQPSSLAMLEQHAAYFASAERASEYAVIVLGGSVAQMAAEEGRSAMEGVLDADPRLQGRKPRVLAWGRGSFKQPQPAMLLQYLLASGLRPDAVVEIDGFNEVVVGCENSRVGVHPLYPSWRPWCAIANQRALDPAALAAGAELALARERIVSEAERGWFGSALLGRYRLGRLEALRTRWGEAQRRYIESLGAGGNDPARGPAWTDDGDRWLDVLARGWSESSLTMHAACAARGIRYVHVLQPTLHDPGAKPMTPLEIERGALSAEGLEGVQKGYPRLRELGAVLRANGVTFVDLSRIFEQWTETAYFDNCHFAGAALDRFSAAVAYALLEQL